MGKIQTHHLHPVPLITSPDNIAAVEAEADAAHGPLRVGEAVPADELRSVPEGDEGVCAADGDVAAARTLRYREAGGGVCVQGVEEGL